MAISYEQTSSSTPIIVNNTKYYDAKYVNDSHIFVPKNTTNVSNVELVDLSGINGGAQINTSVMNITLNGNPLKACIISLKDPALDAVRISQYVQCSGSKTITLNKVGNDALQVNLSNNLFGFIVKDEDNNTVPFNQPQIKIKYNEPTYYAQVVNGVVVNVIVADASFIQTQHGTWIQTKPDGSIRGNFAIIGSSYDISKDQFIYPQPYPSWTLGSDGKWVAPVSYPQDGHLHFWNENTKTWSP